MSLLGSCPQAANKMDHAKKHRLHHSLNCKVEPCVQLAILWNYLEAAKVDKVLPLHIAVRRGQYSLVCLSWSGQESCRHWKSDCPASCPRPNRRLANALFPGISWGFKSDRYPESFAFAHCFGQGSFFGLDYCSIISTSFGNESVRCSWQLSSPSGDQELYYYWYYESPVWDELCGLYSKQFR